MDFERFFPNYTVKASPAQPLQVLVSYFPTNSLSKDNF